MLPIILGGIALAATGYKLKKYLEDDENEEKITKVLNDGYEWLEKTDERVINWIDSFIYPNEEVQYRGYHFVDLSDKIYLDEKLDNALAPFFEITFRLNETLYSEIEALKRTIKNIPLNNSIPNVDDLIGKKTLSSTDENTTAVDMFCQTMTKAEQVQHNLLDALEVPLGDNDDFNALQNDEQTKLVRLITLHELMQMMGKIPITYDGETVSKTAKIVFRKIDLFFYE